IMTAALSSNRTGSFATKRSHRLSLSRCSWVGAEAERLSASGGAEGTEVVANGKIEASAAGSDGISGNGAEALSFTVYVIEASPIRLLIALGLFGELLGRKIDRQLLQNLLTCCSNLHGHSRETQALEDPLVFLAIHFAYCIGW